MRDTYLGEAGFLFPQIFCGSVIGEELFFSASNINGIYSLNLYSGIISFKCFFEGEDYVSKFLFSECIGFENKVFFVPDEGKMVEYYNVTNNIVKPVQNKFKNEICTNRYLKIIQKDIYFYSVPFRGGKIIKVNMRDEKIERVYDVEKRYYEIFGKHFGLFTDSGLYIFNNVIYGAFREEPIIFKLDIESETIDFVYLSELHEGFSQLEGEEDKLVLLNLEKKIVIFDIPSETISESVVLKPEIEPINFRTHYKQGKNICFCSYYEDNPIILANINEKRYEIRTVEEEWRINKEEGEKYRNVYEGSGTYAIFVSNKGKLVWRNLINGQTGCVRLIYKPDPAILSEYKNAGGICIAEDGDLMCIEDLIQYCANNKNIIKGQSIGEEIFKKTCC